MWTQALEKLFQEAMDEYNEQPTFGQIQAEPKYKDLAEYKYFDEYTFELRVINEKSKRLKKRCTYRLNEAASSSKAKVMAVIGDGFSLRITETGTLAK